MSESEIKKMIKNEYNDVTDDDVNEIYQMLVENNVVPKNEKELQNLFKELDERDKYIIWDDSDDEIISSK